MDSNRWRVRIPEGIFGPFTHEQIRKLGMAGILTGEEDLASEHSENWIRMAEKPEFYELVLELIEKGVRAAPPFQRAEELKKLQKMKNPDVSKVGTEHGKTVRLEEPSATLDLRYSAKKTEVIELQKHVTPKSSAARRLLPAIFVLGVALVYVLFSNDGASPGGKQHLEGPKTFKDTMPESELKKALGEALAFFERDDYRSYLKAQDRLIGILETASRSSDSFALLCLTYRELWPFAFQDSEDLSTVVRVAQMATKKDPIGINGSTCKSVHLSLSGRNAEAAGLVDTVLNQKADAVVFYEMKAMALVEKKDFFTALPFAQKARQLWPNYLKYQVLEADLLLNLAKIAEAAVLFRGVLKANPSHSTSRAKLGIIELKANRPTEAMGLLNDALKSSSRLSPDVEAEARMALAQIHEGRGDAKSALAEAKAAYRLKPEWPTTREALSRLGGEKALEELSALNRESMALGDQYFRAGNFLAAQAAFKSAFEDDKKNARAALMAGKSLLHLNRTVDAIEWFERSAATDPGLVDAHLLLADVYSKRFDFASAQAVLRKIQAKEKANGEIYRGFALIELRRNNYLAATQYCEKSLKLYDSDLDAHMIMARAYWGQRKTREAYTWAAKAIEMDQTSSEAQGLYSEILADFQGAGAGADYIKRLIHTYPSNLEYRLSLARIYRRDEKNKDSLAVIQQVTQSDPSNKAALLLQGELLQAEKQFDEALSTYLAAAALDPSDAGPIFLAGQVYLDNSKPTEAIQQFERVLSSNPRYPLAHLMTGKAAIIAGDLERAQKEAELEKRMNPSLAESYLLLGDILMERRQYSRAAQEFQVATKYRPNSAELYVKLARAYRMSGQPDLAVSMLRVAATNESGRPDIYKEQGAVFELKGMPEAAIKSYQRYLDLVPNAPDRSAIADRIRNLGG